MRALLIAVALSACGAPVHHGEFSIQAPSFGIYSLQDLTEVEIGDVKHFVDACWKESAREKYERVMNQGWQIDYFIKCMDKKGYKVRVKKVKSQGVKNA